LIFNYKKEEGYKILTVDSNRYDARYWLEHFLAVDAFEDENYPEVKKVFINSEILEEWGDKWEYEEGCLSIPHIREKVSRHAELKLKYQDEHFNWHEETFTGIAARVIQHEYDHCKGKLFVDYISELKRRLIKNKLINISKGGANVDYKMRIPNAR
jgi:peptide deformylase